MRDAAHRDDENGDHAPATRRTPGRGAGERDLAVALTEKALDDARLGTQRRKRARRLSGDAQWWFFHDPQAHQLYGFGWVCAQLDWDLEAVRARISGQLMAMGALQTREQSARAAVATWEAWVAHERKVQAAAASAAKKAAVRTVVGGPAQGSRVRKNGRLAIAEMPRGWLAWIRMSQTLAVVATLSQQQQAEPELALTAAG